MNLSLVRKWYTSHSVTGELFVNGERECYTLELPDLNNQHGVSCIPEGGYDVSLYFSGHHKRWVLLLHDVPNRDMIEIHPANYPKELLGCIAVGVVREIDAVFQSQVAFDALFAKVNGAFDQGEKVRIVITKEK